jgi:hypothetical protein
MVQIHSPDHLPMSQAAHRINDLHHTIIRRAPGYGLGILFSNRLHATNPSRLNSVSYGARCTHAASPGLGKLSTRSRFLEEKSNCKPKSGALHGQVTPVGSPRALPDRVSGQ